MSGPERRPRGVESGRLRLPEIGTPAPSFRLPTAAGNEVGLEDYRGTSVVLWFSKGLF